MLAVLALLVLAVLLLLLALLVLAVLPLLLAPLVLVLEWALLKIQAKQSKESSIGEQAVQHCQEYLRQPKDSLREEKSVQLRLLATLLPLLALLLLALLVRVVFALLLVLLLLVLALLALLLESGH